jgi:hypothetical protein
MSAIERYISDVATVAAGTRASAAGAEIATSIGRLKVANI